MQYTYRELTKIFGFSSNHIKRYAVYALGIDNNAPKAGGVRRIIDLNGAIKIYVIAKLIGKLRMGSVKAKEIIHKLKTDEPIWSVKLEEGIYVNFLIDEIRNLLKK